MSVPFHPDTFAFAVVEYLDSSRHLLEVVEHTPENEQQYRLVCVARTADEAWKIAHLLRAASGRPRRQRNCTSVRNENSNQRRKGMP